MSQANINLPNSAGNIFRANNNAALAAIMSSNAGPNPPSSPDQGWFWLDTNTPTTTIWTLNIYTGAAWIPILHVDASTGVAYPVQGIPVGATLEWNSDLLPPGFLFENGQAISRTTYSLLFARISTQFGAGDGSSTFNLPDSRNMVAVGKGDMGGSDRGLITAVVVGFNPLTLGASGGSQLAQLPVHSHGLTQAPHAHSLANTARNILGGSAGAANSFPDTGSLVMNTNAASISISVNNAGTANASGLQPSIIKAKIIFTGVFV